MVFYARRVESFPSKSRTTYPEIDFTARTVGELAFIQYLEQDHNDILRFMSIVKKAP